mgnify:CR=1 FL=1
MNVCGEIPRRVNVSSLHTHVTWVRVRFKSLRIVMSARTRPRGIFYTTIGMILLYSTCKRKTKWKKGTCLQFLFIYLFPRKTILPLVLKSISTTKYTNLPSCESFDAILIMVDYFTRMWEIFKGYGFPYDIISNPSPQSPIIEISSLFHRLPTRWLSLSYCILQSFCTNFAHFSLVQKVLMSFW